MISDEEQHNVWPAFTDVSFGLRMVYCEADRAAYLGEIEQSWIDIWQKSLREQLAMGGAFDW